jgi:L-lactate dehydrogenase complex protein LldG
VVESKEQAAAQILSFLPPAPARVAYAANPMLLDLLRSAPALEARLHDASLERQIDVSNLGMEPVATGITGADFLVARTGSVVLCSNTQGGRRLAVLPELHIVYTSEAQLVASLEDCIPELKIDPAWSAVSIISGPSRTSDIEKTLVLGAHGPKRLVVIIQRLSEE